MASRVQKSQMGRLIHADLVGAAVMRGRWPQVENDFIAIMGRLHAGIEKKSVSVAEGESPVGPTPMAQRKGPRFRDSWVVERPQGAAGKGDFRLEGSLSNTAPHAPFVMQKTKRHVIEPRRKDPRARLRWVAAGDVIWARRVRHPGTKANDVLGRTLARLDLWVDGPIEDTGSELINRLVKALTT